MKSSSDRAPHLAFFYPQLKKLTGAQRLILMLAKYAARAGARVTLVTHRLAPEVRAAVDPAVTIVETGRRVDRFGHHYLDAVLEYLLAPALLRAIPRETDGVVFFGPPSLPALWTARRRWGRTRPLLYFCYEPPRAAYSDRALVAAPREGAERAEERGRQRGRDPTGQTAETSSSSATRKEEPQPQAATTFGFSTLKPAPCIEST